MVSVFFDKDIRPQLISLINGAKYEIIASVSWFTDRTIFSSLIQALSRGIKIRLLIQDDEINQNAPFNIDDIAVRGAQIYLWDPAVLGTMHHKFIVIDSARAMAGSYNWTISASGYNKENANVFRGEDQVVDKYTSEFDQMTKLAKLHVVSENYISETPTGTDEFGKFNLEYSVDEFSDSNLKLHFTPKYDWIGEYFYGLACVESNHKYGFIDQAGTLVIPLIYDSLSSFRNGFAIVMTCETLKNKEENYEALKRSRSSYFQDGFNFYKINAHEGLIDREGKEITPLKYDQIYGFIDGFAQVKLNNKYGFINTDGEEIIPAVHDYVWDFHDGLAKVQLNRKYGFYDRKGKIIIPVKYDNSEFLFKEGITEVEVEGKYALMNINGKEIIPFKYDNKHFIFFDDFCKVTLNNKSGYIDITGKEIVSPIYDNAIDFSGGMARVGLNGKHGFINNMGKPIIPLKYNNEHIVFKEGLAKVTLDSKSGFINIKGIEVIPIKYDDVWDFKDGIAKVMIDSLYGFIDKKGKVIIPIIYENSNIKFPDCLSKVMRNNKWGYINNKGEEIITLKYDAVFEFSEGLAMVKLDSKNRIESVNIVIDTDENIVIPSLPEYENEDFAFHEGLAKVKLKNKYGFIDKVGKQVIPLIYDDVFHFYDGIARVAIIDKYGYIDLQGKLLCECKWSKYEIAFIRLPGSAKPPPFDLEDFDLCNFYSSYAKTHSSGFLFTAVSNDKISRYISTRALYDLQEKENRRCTDPREFVINRDGRIASVGEYCELNIDELYRRKNGVIDGL